MLKRYHIVVSLLFLIIGCSPKSEYQNKVEDELSSGIRQDSLFMGIFFGMTNQEFYAHCMELNKQGHFYESPEIMVEFQLTELKHACKMTFFPNYHDDKIHEMPIIFSYNGWAPWNKHLAADSLRKDVLELFDKWYGEGYIEVKTQEEETVLVKINGNRKITIYEPKNDDRITVLFSDLLAEDVEKK